MPKRTPRHSKKDVYRNIDLKYSVFVNDSGSHTWFVKYPLCWRPSSNPRTNRLNGEKTTGPLKFQLGGKTKVGFIFFEVCHQIISAVRCIILNASPYLNTKSVQYNFAVAPCQCKSSHLGTRQYPKGVLLRLLATTSDWIAEMGWDFQVNWLTNLGRNFLRGYMCINEHSIPMKYLKLFSSMLSIWKYQIILFKQ